jgi:PKD repeat protein
MTQPVISQIEAPPTATVGTPFTVKVDAADPTSGNVTFTVTATNSATSETATATQTITVADPITVALTCDDPSVQIVPDADGVSFTVTVTA